jgi:hypothetical protein
MEAKEKEAQKADARKAIQAPTFRALPSSAAVPVNLQLRTLARVLAQVAHATVLLATGLSADHRPVHLAQPWHRGRTPTIVPAMRTLLATTLCLLAACTSLPHASIRTSVREHLRIDGLRGERVQLRNEGPDDLVFKLVPEKGPPQEVRIAPGLAWDFPLEGLRWIDVTHEGQGRTGMQVTVLGSGSRAIRVLPMPE